MLHRQAIATLVSFCRTRQSDARLLDEPQGSRLSKRYCATGAKWCSSKALDRRPKKICHIGSPATLQPGPVRAATDEMLRGQAGIARWQHWPCPYRSPNLDVSFAQPKFATIEPPSRQRRKESCRVQHGRHSRVHRHGTDPVVKVLSPLPLLQRSCDCSGGELPGRT